MLVFILCSVAFITYERLAGHYRQGIIRNDFVYMFLTGLTDDLKLMSTLIKGLCNEDTLFVNNDDKL